MNIFWLDEDLDKAAEAHPTSYTKLILEAGQCLCSALHINGFGEQSPYGKGYINHPISRWASESKQNWLQLLDYMSALHDHYYDYTYDELKTIPDDTCWKLWEQGDSLFHKTVVQIATSGVEKLVELTFPDVGSTARPKCVADFCKEPGVVETYRKYIVCCKYHYDWFEWSAGEPAWFQEYKEKYAKEYRQGQFKASAE